MKILSHLIDAIKINGGELFTSQAGIHENSGLFLGLMTMSIPALSRLISLKMNAPKLNKACV